MENKATDSEQGGESFVERRRHPRSVFTYPAEFKVLSGKTKGTTYAGNLRDISLGGAALSIGDPYHRFNIDEAQNGTILLTLTIPRTERSNIYADIQWVKRKEGTLDIEMGITFKDLDYGDSIVIEKLIGLKNKDHNMMWNLWEQYYR